MASTTENEAGRSGRWGTRKGHAPRHAAGTDRGEAADVAARPTMRPRVAGVAWRSLPRGDALDERTFGRRHLLLCWVLALHLPALLVIGVVQGFDLGHLALELSVPLACVVFARLAVERRLASVFVTVGLVSCSVVLVHLTGGVIEAHFHFFVVVGLIALYQDWLPFLCNVVATVVSHGVGSAIAGDIMFTHGEGQDRPWLWAAIHGLAVLAACAGQVILWQHTEQERERSVGLVADLAAADAARREAVSDLLVNLARRNQSLLNRQLAVIAELQQREGEPEVLDELFRLDHLATRIRRNAESLLVLSGDEPTRRWGRPVPLGDVVRAAVAEIEDHRRVEVLVNDHIEVEGRVVADLAHLLAELIENATAFSPPATTVQVRSHLSAGDPAATVLSVEDTGIGMTDDEMRAANALLADAANADGGWSAMLGFHVVGRLAQRYGLGVRLAPTPGGGITAMVTLPGELVAERHPGTPTTAGRPAGTDRYRRAAAVARARRAEHAPDVPPPGETPGLPALRELPPAPLPVPKVISAAEANDEPPVRVSPIVMGPASAPTAGGGPERRDLPQPADWWWESEALVRSAPTGGADLPALPTGPAATPTPAAPTPTGPTVGTPTPAPPTPATPTPAAPMVSTPTPVTPTPAGPTVGGLERRVPGTHLAPYLRRSAAPQATDPAAPAPAPAAPPTPSIDREKMRTMLSIFQERQRAGRAAADPSADDADQENP